MEKRPRISATLRFAPAEGYEHGSEGIKYLFNSRLGISHKYRIFIPENYFRSFINGRLGYMRKKFLLWLLK